MLRDITLGQFVPGNSLIHRMDARAKVILVIVFTVMLFVAQNFVSLACVAAFLITAAVVSKVSPKLLIRTFKPLLPFILFTVVLNMFYVSGETWVEFWIFKITYQGVYVSIMMVARILFMLIGSALLTFTTSPIVLTDALERLMKPLALIRVPVHDIAMMMTIALRFIPTLIDETDKIMNAQKARGADMESGSLMHRVKALVPILVPLFVSAFKRADELALAMECRCYSGGEGRTRLKEMRYSGKDAAAAVLTLCVLGAVIFFNSRYGSIYAK